MKTLLTVSISFLLTFSLFAQDYVAEVDLSRVKPSKSSKKMNKIYLSMVDSYDQAEYINDVHSKISNFNIKKLNEYKGKNRPFEVKFKYDKGDMLVKYDLNGNIISTLEKYNNVKLPRTVLEKAFKGHEGWGISKTKYVLNYKEGVREGYYLVQIRKNGNKKQLKVDATGELL
ncbi:hypothetical protein [Aegicerativicinus sediminis]